MSPSQAGPSQSGGINIFGAIGDVQGDIVGGNKIIGIPPEQVAVITAALGREQKLTDEQRRTIADLEKKLGASAGAVKAFFRVLGEADISLERQEAKLVEIAERHRQLVSQIAVEPGDDPEVAKLKEEAKTALNAGQLERADDLLAKVQTAQDAALDRRQLEAAATAARRGEIALTRLRYRDAARHFAAAAQRVPPGKEEQSWAYLHQEADALYRQGGEFGDNSALTDAIDRYQVLLKRHPRERVPLLWAITQNNLASSLGTLANLESGTDWESGTRHVEEAIAALHAVLQEWTRDRMPLQWAATQNNLGNALALLGKRESGTQWLEEAIEAYRAALDERTRQRVPRGWAATQNDLGKALQALGELESGTKGLVDAVEAYNLALQERTRDRVPLQWAATHINLGLALQRLGERSRDRGKLQEARDAISAAFGVFMQAGQEHLRQYFEKLVRAIDRQLAGL